MSGSKARAVEPDSAVPPDRTCHQTSGSALSSTARGRVAVPSANVRSVHKGRITRRPTCAHELGGRSSTTIQPSRTATLAPWLMAAGPTSCPSTPARRSLTAVNVASGVRLAPKRLQSGLTTWVVPSQLQYAAISDTGRGEPEPSSTSPWTVTGPGVEKTGWLVVVPSWLILVTLIVKAGNSSSTLAWNRPTPSTPRSPARVSFGESTNQNCPLTRFAPVMSRSMRLPLPGLSNRARRHSTVRIVGAVDPADSHSAHRRVDASRLGFDADTTGNGDEINAERFFRSAQVTTCSGAPGLGPKPGSKPRTWVTVAPIPRHQAGFMLQPSVLRPLPPGESRRCSTV